MNKMTNCVWEPLAEIEFDLPGSEHFRIYCLCSRAFVRSKIKSGWEELARKKLSECKMDDEPTVSMSYSERSNFDLKTCNKQEVEAVSCYCSASHYSTDDYESAKQTALDQNISKGQASICLVQNSDSGADLSEHFTEKQCCKKSDEKLIFHHYTTPKLETAWEKYWSKNGECIIWKSWIEKFGSYINPSYLEHNSFLESFNLELNDFKGNVNEYEKKLDSSKICATDNILNIVTAEVEKVKNDNFRGSVDTIPNLKISSYSSSSSVSEAGGSVNKNTCMEESDGEDKILKSNSFGSCTSYEKKIFLGSSDDGKLKNDCERVRSRCSNTSLSVRSIANTTVTTDSMTNVTKITLSSLDLSCESESIRSGSFLSASSDDNSGLSSTSTSSSKEEMCLEADVWWKKAWEEHYQEQYKSSFEKFADNFHETNNDIEERVDVKSADNEEVKEVLKENDGHAEVTEKNKVFKSKQYYNSVAYCLQRLEKSNAQLDLSKTTNSDNQFDWINEMPHNVVHRDSSTSPENSKKGTENSDDSLEDIQEFTSKRRKKINDKNRKDLKQPTRKIDNIKQAMTLMGFSFSENSDAIQSGFVTYRKKNIRGQNRRLKLSDVKPKMHLFFDEDGNVVESKPGECTDASQSLDGEEGCEISESDPKKLEDTCVDPELLGYEAHSSSVEDCDANADENRKQRKRKKKLKKCGGLPQEIVENKNLFKYWLRRYELFSKFDLGIKLDSESWFSVTPEKLAQHHAERCKCDVLVDAFCGAGGNSIQFAFTCERVIAIDIDPQKIKMAKHNAKIYGVEERIEFIIGDFTKLAGGLRGDVVFLSPPWGGPEYKTRDVYDLDSILPPLGGVTLFRLATEIADDVAFFLPKNANSTELALLSGPGGEIEIEQNFTDRRLRSVTAYFGELIMNPEDPYI